MTIQAPEAIGFPEVIDASMLSTFKACPHKFFLEYLNHWRPVEPNIDLHAGKAFASGLEAARLAFYAQGRPESEALEIGLRSLVQAYGSFTCPPGSAKDLPRMCGALEHYFTRWPLSEDAATPIILTDGAKRGIEFSFVEPLPINHPVTGAPILYSGRADMLVDFAGDLWGEDDKTAKQLGKSWVEQWDLRSQFSGYIWGFERALGRRPRGFVIRGVSILKEKYGDAEAITYRDAWEVEEWLQVTLYNINDMIRMWSGITEKLSSAFPKNLDQACSHYGGCVFRRICKSQEPEPWLRQRFEQRRWDPTTRTEHPL